uniref:Uncharacterized protein n=1 Tax=Oryza meridionalis TaxID=40149 RepID=A0A0E0EE45_9ORYZ
MARSPMGYIDRRRSHRLRGCRRGACCFGRRRWRRVISRVAFEANPQLYYHLLRTAGRVAAAAFAA